MGSPDLHNEALPICLHSIVLAFLQKGQCPGYSHRGVDAVSGASGDR